MSKKFHLGDLLSVTTHILLSPTHMSGLYDILNYMTSDDLFTHQLSRAAKECTPILLEQHPWLADVDTSQVGIDNWQEFLAEMVAKYGEWHEVIPMHPDDHEVKDPIQEAIDLMGEDRVIIVRPPEDDYDHDPYGNITWNNN